MYLAQVTPRVTDSYRSHRIAKIVFYDNTHVVSDRTVSLQLLFMINQWLIFWGQKWKTCLLFLQFDKTVCRLLCFKVTDTWTITLLSRFQRLRNLLVLKFGLYIFGSYFPVNMIIFKSLPHKFSRRIPWFMGL